MAVSFGGGIARWGEVCGAVAAGAMALGFAFGPTKGEEKDQKEKLYTRVQGMMKEFTEAFGTVRCRELIQGNLLDPEERKRFQRVNRPRCAQYVAGNAEIVRRLLKEK
jgi:C_GCAxxG_C_C family probable redox protein